MHVIPTPLGASHLGILVYSRHVHLIAQFYVHLALIILGTPLSCTNYNQGTRTNSTIAHAHGIYYPWYTPFIHLSTTRMHPPNSKILCSHSTYHLWYTPFIHLNTILACTPKNTISCVLITLGTPLSCT